MSEILRVNGQEAKGAIGRRLCKGPIEELHRETL